MTISLSPASPSTIQLPLWRVLVLLLTLATITACGSTGDESLDAPADVTARAPEAVTSQWSTILHGSAYAGKIALMFADGTDVRLVNGQLTSRTGMNMARIQKALSRVPGLVIERGMREILDEDIQRARIAARSRGYSLEDWSLYYLLTIPDAQRPEQISRTEQLLRDLAAEPSVRFVHPKVRRGVAGNTTPNIEPLQTPYLAAGNGGLNIAAAWDLGLHGNGVTLVDIEGYWNFSHEDLSITENAVIKYPNNGATIYAATDPTTQHGTAVMGILVGQKNAYGIQGIASEAKVKLIQTNQMVDEPYQFISLLIADLNAQNVLGPGGLLEPGSIVVGEVSISIKGTDCPVVDGTSSGCGPMEVFADSFLAIKDVVNQGVVVIEAAGNGGMNLGSPEAHAGSIDGKWSPDLGTDDAGAIMVGASTGAAMTRLPSSNCGARLNVFACGVGITSTGYGDLGYGADPNQWYTQSFGGTSAATAQIAGAAALLQQYTHQLYTAQTKPWQRVYLNAQQMRQVLTLSGQPAQNSNDCPIGVQPDLGKALQLLKAKTVTPTIEDKPLYLCDSEGWCKAWCQAFSPKGEQEWCKKYLMDEPQQGLLAPPMDLDGDGRGDLISFSKDRQWYIDLSSEGAGGDHYGAWDLTFAADATLPADAMLFPVVGDYNTDGKADLALYDAKYGQWYIRFTDSQILSNNWGTGWSKVIDYSTAAGWAPYSRPVPGDYNGADTNDLTFDRWLDPALATPSGHLLIDVTSQTEGQSAGTMIGTFDQNVAFLSPAQLQAAPGWAYLPAPVYYSVFEFPASIGYAAPPNLPDCSASSSLNSDYVSACIGDYNSWSDPSAVLVGASGNQSLSQKQANGKWVNQTNQNDGKYIYDTVDFGNLQCRPILADYDGDGILDRAVQCPTEWRIEYGDHIFQNDADGLHHVKYTDKMPANPLPGYVYPGGVAYDDIKAIYEYYLKQTGCQGSACTIFDLTKNYPPPVGPYFAECLKYWSTQPLNCLKY